MKKRSPFLLVTGLAVFVLLLGGVIASSLAYKTIRSEMAQSDPAFETGVNGGNSLTPNSRDSSLLAVPVDVAPGAASAQPQLISAQRAERIALTLVPGAALLQAPELVNYQGRMAYEVQISGGILYLDAFSGAVLGVVGSGALASASQQGPQGIVIRDRLGMSSDQAVVTNMPDTSGALSGKGEIGEHESNDDDEGEYHKEHDDVKRHENADDDHFEDSQEHDD